MSDNFTMAVRQGDTYSLTLSYQDTAGVPINLTGYSYEWSVSVGDVANVYTGLPKVAVPTPSTGIITLTLSASDTSAYLTGRGRFFLRITSGSGVVSTLLEGPVEVDFTN